MAEGARKISLSWTRSRHLVFGAVVAALIATSGVTLALAGGRSSASQADPVGDITVSSDACAPGWIAPQSGDRVFELTNTTRSSVFEVELVGADQVRVYGELEMLAPHTTVAMDVVLPPGRYSFACESFAGSTSYSRPETVSGPAVRGAHPFTPVEIDQVQQATVNYQNSLLPYLARLERDTDALTRAVDADDLALARLRWLPAHLDYARLGAAYDTFGNFNAEIDGRPLGLVGGVSSPDFQGFLRLEYGLWHGQPAAVLVPVADALDHAVHGLVHAFPSMVMPMNDLALRTHEILENTLQFELTAETDEGSNTNLATAWANAQGTELSLEALRPLLQVSDPSLLRSVSAGLGAVTAEFKSYERPNGSWIPLQSLPAAARERLDGSLGALLEQLSVIPDLFDLPVQPENPND